MNKIIAVGALSFLSATLLAETERIFRPVRNTRGNTNIMKIQPIDSASWIWHKDDLAMSGGAGEISHLAQKDASVCPVMVFEKDFEVKDGEKPFEIDVSADERFYLTLDGEFVARGPNRADVSNWQYNTYRVRSSPASTSSVRSLRASAITRRSRSFRIAAASSSRRPANMTSASPPARRSGRSPGGRG